MEFLVQLLQNLLFLALHIDTRSSFPKPLSKSEEILAFEKYRITGNKAYRDKLIRHNLRLVAHIAKKYFNQTGDQDDLISIGTLGLIKAVDTFDYEKGTRFATYGARCIENEILMYFRSMKKSATDVYISDPLDMDEDGNSISLIDIMSDEKDISETVGLSMEIEKLKKILPKALNEREMLIINRRYGLDGKAPFPQREIAKQLKISRSYVSRIEKTALDKLRKEFEKQ